MYLHGRHPPVIHRDIKPSNILLTDRSGNSVGQVYLVDFGSVQTLAARRGSTMTVVGTYGYLIIPIFYQTHLESQLERSQYLILSILINLLQSIKQVSLEALATAFPLPILFTSRRRKIQRFLPLPCLEIEALWFQIIKKWLADDFPVNQVLYIAIDRTSWGCINLLMLSLI